MIILHVGKIGVGKSYACTKEIWQNVLSGKDSYIDWEVDFTEQMKSHRKGLIFFWKFIIRKFTLSKEPRLGRVFFYQDLEDIYGISRGEIYMDEAHRFLSARKWETIPPNFIKKMSQSRKYATNLHFITQHQNMIDVNIRRLCNEIVIYKKFGYLMYYNSYDGAYIDQLDKDPALKPKSSGFRLYWFSKAFAKSYDTYKIFGDKFEPYRKDPLWSYEKYLKHLSQPLNNKRKPRNYREMFPTFLLYWEALKNNLAKGKEYVLRYKLRKEVKQEGQRVFQSNTDGRSGTIKTVHVLSGTRFDQYRVQTRNAVKVPDRNEATRSGNRRIFW
jgi:hypothetical protein